MERCDKLFRRILSVSMPTVTDPFSFRRPQYGWAGREEGKVALLCLNQLFFNYPRPISWVRTTTNTAVSCRQYPHLCS